MAELRPENPWVQEPVTIDGVLDRAFCEELVASIPEGAWKPAMVVSRSHDDASALVVRRDEAVRTAEEHPAPFEDRPEVFQLVADAIRDANRRRFRYDLVGWPGSDRPVLLRYRGEEGGHFVLHTDLGRAHTTRKLSFSLQLSSPAEYEGGRLRFPRLGFVAGAEQGSLTIFPSFLPHVVEPVTSGLRVVLVGWFHGPAFR